jgi:hypothetical protein
MLDAEVLGPAGGMQGIALEQQAKGRQRVIRIADRQRAVAAAHGSPSEDEPIRRETRAVGQVGDGFPHGLQKNAWAVRRPSPGGPVGKVEPQ